MRSHPYTLGSSEIAEMGEAKHTPTPWTASEMEMSRADWAALNPAGETLQIVKHGSDVIAAVWAEDGVEEKANAEFITRACNAHDDLVAALKATEREYEDLDEYAPVDSGCIECTLGTVPNHLNTGLCAHHLRKAALAKAESRS